MSTAYLFQNVTAAQTTPAPTSPPTLSVTPQAGSAFPVPNPYQAFQLIVNGTSGTVSCSAQPIVSNDGLNWSNYGSALAVTTAATPANTVTTLQGAYQFYSAYVVSISGTGASASMLMSA